MSEYFEMNPQEAYEFFYAFNYERIKNKIKNQCVRIKLTKEQAKNGIEKEISYNYIDYCLHDNSDKEKCSKCFGYGLDIHNTEKIKVKIPPKVKHNDRIVFKNKGSRYDREDVRGELQIVVKIYGNKSEKEGKIIYG